MYIALLGNIEVVWMFTPKLQGTPYFRTGWYIYHGQAESMRKKNDPDNSLSHTWDHN